MVSNSDKDPVSKETGENFDKIKHTKNSDSDVEINKRQVLDSVAGALDSENLENNNYKTKSYDDFLKLFELESEKLDFWELEKFYQEKKIDLNQRRKSILLSPNFDQNFIWEITAESTNMDKAFVITVYQKAIDSYNKKRILSGKEKIKLEDLGCIIFNGGSGANSTTPISDIDAVFILKDQNQEKYFLEVSQFIAQINVSTRIADIFPSELISPIARITSLKKSLNSAVDKDDLIYVLREMENILKENNIFLLNAEKDILNPEFKNFLENFFKEWKKVWSYLDMGIDDKSLKKSISHLYKILVEDTTTMLREHQSLSFIGGCSEKFKEYRGKWSKLFKENHNEVQAIFMVQYKDSSDYPKQLFNVKDESFRYLQYALGITLLENGEIYPKPIINRIDELLKEEELEKFEAKRMKTSINAIFYLRHLFFLASDEDIIFKHKKDGENCVNLNFINWAKTKGLHNIEQIIHKARIAPYHTSALYRKQKDNATNFLADSPLEKVPEATSYLMNGLYENKVNKILTFKKSEIQDEEDFLMDIFGYIATKNLTPDLKLNQEIQRRISVLNKTEKIKIQNKFSSEWMEKPYFSKICWFLSRVGYLKQIIQPYGNILGKIQSEEEHFDSANETLLSLHIFDKEIKSEQGSLKKIGEKIKNKGTDKILYWSLLLAKTDELERNKFIEDLDLGRQKKEDIKFLIEHKNLLTQNGFDISMSGGQYFMLALKLKEKLKGQEYLISPLLAINYSSKKAQNPEDKNLKKLAKEFKKFHIQFGYLDFVEKITTGEFSEYFWGNLEKKIDSKFSKSEDIKIFLQNYKKNPQFLYARLIEIIENKNFPEKGNNETKINFLIKNFNINLLQKKSEIVSGKKKFLVENSEKNKIKSDIWVCIKNNPEYLENLGILCSNYRLNINRISIFPLNQAKILVHITTTQNKNLNQIEVEKVMKTYQEDQKIETLRKINPLKQVNVDIDFKENAFEISSKEDSLYIFSRIMSVLKKLNLTLSKAVFVPDGKNQTGFRDKIFLEEKITESLGKKLKKELKSVFLEN